MKTGICKYGATCKFDHPPPGELIGVTSQVTSTSVGEEEGYAKLVEAIQKQQQQQQQ